MNAYKKIIIEKAIKTFGKEAQKDMMIEEMLQHVSFDPVPNGLFIPRVPESRIVQGDYFEDDTIERICFSVSIENCINAMPDGGYAVLGLNEMKKKGFTPILYSYNLFWNGENEVLTPKEVKKYVYDAEATNEYWLTTQKTINPIILEILNFEYSMEKAINGPILPVIRELDCDVFKGELKDFRTFFKAEKQFNKYSNRDLLSYVGQCCYPREETKDAARK